MFANKDPRDRFYLKLFRHQRMKQRFPLITKKTHNHRKQHQTIDNNSNLPPFQRSEQQQTANDQQVENTVDLQIYNNILSNLFPHGIKLQKNDRDLIEGTNIICCKYVLKVLDLDFYNSIINNPLVLQILNLVQQEIVQDLVDITMYGKCEPNNFDLVEYLAVLGMIKGGGFIDLTKRNIKQFKSCFKDETSTANMLQLVANAKEFSAIENPLLTQMFEYSLSKAAEFMKQTATILTIL